VQKALLLEENEKLKAQNSELIQALRDQQRKVEDLEGQLAAALRRLYGPRSEKISPGQLEFEFMKEAEENAVEIPPHADEAPDDEETRPQGGRKRGHGRKPLPRDLPRRRIEHHPEDLHCHGCGAVMDRIGEEITEELEYVPASLFIQEHVRIKYACRKCQEGVRIAPLPSRPIEKGRPGPGLLAHVVVSKYGDHLPLNRQAGIFRREGLDLSRSTLCDWIAGAAELALPVYRELKRQVLASDVIQTDDTPVTLQLNSQKGGRKRCFLWVYRGISGPVLFDFTTSRSRAGPREFLGNYRGYLQADAYAGYNDLFKTGRIVEVGCWAHARRYFYEALGTSPDLASLFLGNIRRLYKLERSAKEQGLTEEAILDLRKRKAVPILNDLHEALQATKDVALPKSPLGKAVHYALSNWIALNRYTEDGRLPIDNNVAERCMRKVAVGRKNWLFTGSKEGGHRAAILYSLILSCQEAGVEPFAYLRDLFDRLPSHSVNRIAELTPAGWKAARQAMA